MSKEAIKVEICCGTTCYMLGAADLLKLELLIPEDWHDKVDVCAIPCLEACTDENLGRAPFVRINGTLHGNATVESVCATVRSLLAAKEVEA